MRHVIRNRHNRSEIGRGNSPHRWWAVGDFITVQGTKGKIVEVINHLGRNDLEVEILVEHAE